MGKGQIEDDFDPWADYEDACEEVERFNDLLIGLLIGVVVLMVACALTLLVWS